jgi:hypothetical protein
MLFPVNLCVLCGPSFWLPLVTENELFDLIAWASRRPTLSGRPPASAGGGAAVGRGISRAPIILQTARMNLSRRSSLSGAHRSCGSQLSKSAKAGAALEKLEPTEGTGVHKRRRDRDSDVKIPHIAKNAMYGAPTFNPTQAKVGLEWATPPSVLNSAKSEIYLDHALDLYRCVLAHIRFVPPLLYCI